MPGDDVQLNSLLERHLPGLVTYLRLHSDPVVRQRESCGDLAQSVCREVLEEATSFEFQSEPAFRKWLFSKAASKIADRHRRWLAEKRDVNRELAEDSQPLAASWTSPSAAAIRAEDLDRLAEAYAQLPDDYRRVITLHHVLGMPHAEIARELGRAEGSVRVLLHRAIVRLGWLMTSG